MPNKRVLIVAHENITNNYYAGNNRSCLVSNCLFRVGGAACLMSNRYPPLFTVSLTRASKISLRLQQVLSLLYFSMIHTVPDAFNFPCRPADRKVAKYQLMHSVRSHIGADDDAFNAIRQREDEDGIRGILLQRNVVPTAATALKTNIKSLAPLVLPFTELVRSAFSTDSLSKPYAQRAALSSLPIIGQKQSSGYSWPASGDANLCRPGRPVLSVLIVLGSSESTERDSEFSCCCCR